MTYKALMNDAKKRLKDASIYDGFSRVLLLEMLQEQGLDYYSVIDTLCDEAFKCDYNEKLELLLQDMPMGYVLGYEWFYGYKLKVTPSVLIPRDETQELVEQTLRIVKKNFKDPSIVDVCTGSGAIAIALSKELNLPLVATDISKEALEVAAFNAQSNKADVRFLQGDMLAPLQGQKFDILISNPPYIIGTEDMGSSVIKHEPHLALFGGEDGLDFYRSIFKNAKSILKSKSMIGLEIGFDIGEAVMALARESFPDANIILKQDINGCDRMVFIHFGFNPNT